MKTSISFLIILFSIFTLSAQKAPIKWGKVNAADLEMTTYEADPEADAVILTDYADLRFDLSTGELFYMLERHVRIKILKKSAFYQGDISLPYYPVKK